MSLAACTLNFQSHQSQDQVCLRSRYRICCVYAKAKDTSHWGQDHSQWIVCLWHKGDLMTCCCLNSFPLAELEETTGTPPYYVDEDYPAGPGITEPVPQRSNWGGSESPTLEIDVYILALHTHSGACQKWMNDECWRELQNDNSVLLFVAM